MQFITPNSVTELSISVTTTATSLFTLMESAGSVQQLLKYYADKGANSVIIAPEGGDIRYLSDATPTTAIGVPISDGEVVAIPITDLSKITLISQSGTVTCQVLPYRADMGESPSNMAGSGGGGGGTALWSDANTYLAPASGGSTTSHGLSAANDVVVNRFEANSNAYFDGITAFNTIVGFQGANTNGALMLGKAQATSNKTLMMSGAVDDPQILITPHAAVFSGDDYNIAAPSTPTLRIMADRQSVSTTQRLDLTHDGTNGYIHSPVGYVHLDGASGILFSENGTVAFALRYNGSKSYMIPTSGVYFAIGDKTNTSHSFNTNDDLLVSGRLEVDEEAYFDGRLQESQGADIASANDLTLGSDGNCFEITGTTQINAINTTDWQNGAVVTLLFTSTPTVKHNTSGGAGTVSMLLAGAADFAATAGDTLTLRLCEIGGTQAWREIGRAVI